MLYCKHVPGEKGEHGVDVPIFFQHRDGPILPTLKFVHRFPGVEFTRVTVDKGAIPFLLGGANVMCPGLTNEGAFVYVLILFTHVFMNCCTVEKFALMPLLLSSSHKSHCAHSSSKRRRNATRQRSRAGPPKRRRGDNLRPRQGISPRRRFHDHEFGRCKKEK